MVGDYGRMECIACKVSHIDALEFWTEQSWKFDSLRRSLVDDEDVPSYVVYLKREDGDRGVVVLCLDHAQPYMFRWLLAILREGGELPSDPRVL